MLAPPKEERLRGAEVARLVGISERQLGYWIFRGLLSCVAMEGRYLFQPSDVRRAIAVARLVKAGVSVEFLAEVMQGGQIVGALTELSSAIRWAKGALAP